MSTRVAATGWVLAVVLAATTALFAWQYTQARRAADRIQADYESLQLRVEAQAAQNKEFDATLKSLAQQLDDARTALDLLDKAVQSAPSPETQPDAAPQQP